MGSLENNQKLLRQYKQKCILAIFLLICLNGLLIFQFMNDNPIFFLPTVILILLNLKGLDNYHKKYVHYDILISGKEKYYQVITKINM